jgi:hypothetical protein
MPGGSQMDDADHAAIEQRRQQAIHLKHVVGMSWTHVAQRLGYYDGSHARKDVKIALDRALREQDRLLENLVLKQDIRLDAMRQRAYAIMTADHPLVQGGKIVYGKDGRPLQDVGPMLAGLAMLLKIEERWSNLHGTDASKKLSIALEHRSELESNLVSEAILAAAEALDLPPAQRLLALEAAASRLEVVDAEVVADPPPE